MKTGSWTIRPARIWTRCAEFGTRSTSASRSSSASWSRLRTLRDEPAQQLSRSRLEGRRQPVISPDPTFLRFHEARFFELAHVVRDRRLREVETRGEVAYA